MRGSKLTAEEESCHVVYNACQISEFGIGVHE